MKIGDRIIFTYKEKEYEGLFLEEQLAMFPGYIEAGEDLVKIEIKDKEIRKELKMGHKKYIVIDKSKTKNIEKKSMKIK